MTDGPERMRDERWQDREKPVETLASQALSHLATRRASKSASIDEHHARRLRDAVLSNNPDDRDDIIRSLREHGYSDDIIVDLYIPHVARLLGEDWCNDVIGFADTSIGSSRLQSLLRDLVPPQKPTRFSITDAPGVSIAVLSNDDHTLGAMVLTHQLRRIGASVRVLVGAPRHEALKQIEIDNYDAVFISASRPECLGNLKTFVESVKRQTKQDVPIVVGGRAIEFFSDVKKDVGADYAASTPEEALRLCGLIDCLRGSRTRPQTKLRTASLKELRP